MLQRQLTFYEKSNLFTVLYISIFKWLPIRPMSKIILVQLTFLFCGCILIRWNIQTSVGMLSKACEVGKEISRPTFCHWTQYVWTRCCVGLIMVMIFAFVLLQQSFLDFPLCSGLFVHSSFNHLGNSFLEKFLWPPCVIMFRSLLASRYRNGRCHSWFPVLEQSETGQPGFPSLSLGSPLSCFNYTRAF